VLGAVLVLLLLVAGGIWLLGGRRDARDESSATTPSTAVVTSVATAQDAPTSTTAPPSCPSPRPPEWTDLAVTGNSGADPDARLRFELLGGGYRQLPSGRWQVVLRLRATDVGPSSENHYPFYALFADGTTTPLTCFQVVQGGVRMDPGGSSEALTGFELAAVPTGDLAIDVDAPGRRHRLDVVRATR
jgi:hypothetical protein